MATEPVNQTQNLRQSYEPNKPPTAAQVRASRIKMLLLLLFFAAPVIASYLTYYVIKPEGRTNHGELIEPQREVKALAVAPINANATAQSLPLGQFAGSKGKWIMATLGPAQCDEVCAKRLYYVRQVRKMTGKEMDRVERVWFLTSNALPDATLLAEHEGMHVLRVGTDEARRFFALQASDKLEDYIYMIDPLGNYMMRFPKDADPNKMKKDLSKLLRASRVG
jgi:hypothetical protein